MICDLEACTGMDKDLGSFVARKAMILHLPLVGHKDISCDFAFGVA